MDNTQRIQVLNQIIIALNNVETKGENNFDNLNGSIKILKELLSDILKEQQLKEQEQKVGQKVDNIVK